MISANTENSLGLLLAEELLRNGRCGAMHYSTNSARLLFKGVVQCFADAVFLVNPRGNIEEINAAAASIFATTEASARGRALADVLRADAFADLADQEFFLWSESTDGGGRTFAVRCKQLRPETGLPGFLVILREASDSQQTAEYVRQLEETNRDLDVLFRFSHDGLVLCDGNAVGVRYNEAYTRITGIAGQDLIGRHMTEILESGCISESAIWNALNAKKQVTTMPKLKNGKKVLMTAIPVFDAANNIVKVVGNVRDITELTALEAELDQVRELSERYYNELVHLRSQTAQVEGVIAESPAMRAVLATALKVAATDATVLITGESGSGKEVLARTIHTRSQRKAGPFVKVNCGAIPDTLLESELFGYEKGAFTNAAKTGKMGIFEIAAGGTLFLDEIGEIPLSVQSKLLGVLQDKRFCRVGGTKEIRLDARVIAATNRELSAMVNAGQFRKDLFYRLNVVGLKIPSLTERKEDIFPLARYFLGQLNEKYKSRNSLSPQVVHAFQQYDWPGNVREMENLMEQLVVLAPDEPLVPAMLPEQFHALSGPAGHEAAHAGGTLAEILANVERKVLDGLVRKGFSSYRIAKELGINQSTALRKMKKLGVRGK